MIIQYVVVYLEDTNQNVSNVVAETFIRLTRVHTSSHSFLTLATLASAVLAFILTPVKMSLIVWKHNLSHPRYH